jgi:hypothetical protein
MEMKDCINNLTHSLLQQGDEIRQRSYGVSPSATKDLTSTTSTDGRKKRADAKDQPFSPAPGPHGTGAVQAGTPQTPSSTLSAAGLRRRQVAFKKMKKHQTGRNHLSVPMVVTDSGRECRYEKCPGFNTKANTNRTRAYTTKYKCEECSHDKGIDFWLCHTTKKINGVEVVVDCHTKYHVEKRFFEPSFSTTECTSVSDLTDDS